MLKRILRFDARKFLQRAPGNGGVALLLFARGKSAGFHNAEIDVHGLEIAAGVMGHVVGQRADGRAAGKAGQGSAESFCRHAHAGNIAAGRGFHVPLHAGHLPGKEQAGAGDGLIVFGGRDYGMGSSRDWAAKGTRLLGVRAVVAKSFERIHRSNLVGMGVLPFEFPEGTDAQTLGLNGTEKFSIRGLENGIGPRQKAILSVERPDGGKAECEILLRIDTPIEAEYYKEGGILPFVLKKILNK